MNQHSSDAAPRKPYRTPQLELQGAVEELTLGPPGSANDIALGSAVISSRDLKEQFSPVDGEDVLKKLMALPISTWTYLEAGAPTRHVGPMAQDFAATFGVGASDRYIGTVDAIGVALAAIQGLAAGLEERDKLIAQLRTDVEKLEEDRRRSAN